MATVSDVAKYILTLGETQEEDLISNLKLQKLVYYCQGFSLALRGEPLFQEKIAHWTHGPVCPVLYREYREYGKDAIPCPSGFDPEAALTDEERGLIEDVYATYGQFSAWRLREMTHEELPWRSTPDGGIIPHDLMTEYFRTQIVSE